VVVAEVFNRTGSNAATFESGGAAEDGVIYVDEQGVSVSGRGGVLPPPEPAPRGDNLLATIFGCLVLLLPGLLLVRFLLPGASFGESFGMAFTAGAALLIMVAFVQLAITGSALTGGQAWIALIVSTVIAAAGFVLSGFGSSGPLEPDYSAVGS
jgi:predicted small integral membrane protein